MSDISSDISHKDGNGLGALVCDETLSPVIVIVTIKIILEIFCDIFHKYLSLVSTDGRLFSIHGLLLFFNLPSDPKLLSKNL
jgi:hypothetical protein